MKCQVSDWLSCWDWYTKVINEQLENTTAASTIYYKQLNGGLSVAIAVAANKLFVVWYVGLHDSNGTSL